MIAVHIGGFPDRKMRVNEFNVECPGSLTDKLFNGIYAFLITGAPMIFQ